MTAYILRRLLATIPVMAVVAVFVFFLLRLAPGDPSAIIAGEDATAEQIAAVRGKLGLDRPILEQFAVWVVGMLQGDFGTSIFSNLPVSRLILQRLEPTVSLTLSTLRRRRVPRHPARRARRLEGAPAGRPAGDGVRRHGLRHARVSRRLRADLHVRGQARLAAGAGLPAARRGAVAVGGEPDPALAGARHHLHGADRPHHARLDAGGAGAGLHPHRRTPRDWPPAAC